MVSVIIEKLGDGPPRGRGETAPVGPEATGHVHVRHVGVGANDRTAVKMVHIVVNWIAVNNNGFVKPEKGSYLIASEGLTQI